jgi:hypothetical protein
MSSSMVLGFALVACLSFISPGCTISFFLRFKAMPNFFFFSILPDEPFPQRNRLLHLVAYLGAQEETDPPDDARKRAKILAERRH